jgi:DNA-binding NarL/FixJ family response regulator
MKLHRTIKLAIADDHVLFRNGVAKLIEAYAGNSGDYCNTVEAASGDELLDSLEKLPDPDRPDVILVDLNMPRMDGFQTIPRLRQLYPDIRILVLTMRDDDDAILRSLRLGACGYLTKDIEKEELKEAIDSCLEKGYYYSGHLAKRLVDSVVTEPGKLQEINPADVVLSPRELEFIRLACTDLTYHEIAVKMYLSPRTVDGYRNNLFAKLHVVSRVSLAMWAIRHGIVPLQPSAS